MQLAPWRGEEPYTLRKEMTSMILLFASQRNRVVETLESQLADHKIVRCRSVASMAQRLSKPRHGVEVVLIIVHNSEEMAGISEIKELVRDMRIVMVLPHHDEHMVAWGHQLGPRFIAYADNGYERIGAVLQKMLQVPLRRNAAFGRISP